MRHQLIEHLFRHFPLNPMPLPNLIRHRSEAFRWWDGLYMGEMMQAEHTVHFWRLSAPAAKLDFLVRMAVKDDLVSGILFTVPFGGTGAKK
jgi:hypothetical protein